MSIYQSFAKIGAKFFKKKTLFKYGFNLSPMYRRSTARIISVSEDLLEIKIKLPISYKNRNYVNSIFGGSLFSAVDPIPMVQLINIIGDDYIVWDKSAEILFKKPARENVFAKFIYTKKELEEIRREVSNKNEIEISKSTELVNKEETQIFCIVKKKIYIAKKSYYKAKIKNRKS